MSDKIRVDRLILTVSDEKTRLPALSIDMPTYFKIDTGKLWDVVIKELIKQEKAAGKK